jgi:pyrroline-5-carboxylate reductase
MNAVTALAGSGPAFVSELLDAFALAGVKMGLRYSDALRVAMQTFAGAVELLRERGWHPAVMRDAVASPSGTTIYGLSVMEERGVKGSLIKTLEEAKKRADELS